MSLTKIDGVEFVYWKRRRVVVVVVTEQKIKYFLYFTDRVNHKPIISEPLQNTTVLVDSTHTFRCNMISDLHLVIQWIYSVCANCTNATILEVMVYLNCLF